MIMSRCQNFTTNCQRSFNGDDVGDDDGTLASGLVEVTAFGVVAHIVEDASEGLALEIGTLRIADEIEVHLRLFENDLLDAELLATDTKGHDTNELFSNIRDGAKAVCKTTTIGCKVIIEMLTGSEVVEFTVEQHTLRITGHILIREVHLQIRLEGAIVDE